MTLQNQALHVPELLAPAGGPDALMAAVNNGADAVYLGLSDLNARRGAANFDLESLARVSRFATATKTPPKPCGQLVLRELVIANINGIH